jgi:hypothetical protein
MRRRGFFAKLLGGTVGVAGMATPGAAWAPPPSEDRLVWTVDTLVVGDPSVQTYITSRPVARRSLIVQMNGITLCEGPADDFVARPSDGGRVEVGLVFPPRPGDRVALRYETPEVSA